MYISKTTYIRQGEQSLDGFYRAWHQVEYYRYSCSNSVSENFLSPSVSALVVRHWFHVAFAFIDKMALGVFIQFITGTAVKEPTG